jgi:hypothetical protein
VFKGEDKPLPPRVEDTGLPPEPAATTGTVPALPAPPAAEAPKKKRGFWSRVFGVGRGDDKNNAKDRDKASQTGTGTAGDKDEKGEVR